MKKYVLSIVLLTAAVAGWELLDLNFARAENAAPASPRSPPGHEKSADAIYHTSITELAMAYRNSEAAVDRIIGNRAVEIVGYVARGGRRTDGSAEVVFDVSGGLTRARMEVGKGDFEALATLEVGKPAMVRCVRVRLVNGSPEGFGCEIVKDAVLVSEAKTSDGDPVESSDSGTGPSAESNRTAGKKFEFGQPRSTIPPAVTSMSRNAPSDTARRGESAYQGSPDHFQVQAGLVQIDDGSTHMVLLMNDLAGLTYCPQGWRVAFIETQVVERGSVSPKTNPSACWADGEVARAPSVTLRYFDIQSASLHQITFAKRQVREMTYEWRTQQLH